MEYRENRRTGDKIREIGMGTAYIAEVERSEVKIPTARPVDISRMNAETLDMELEKGYADMQAGRTKSAAQVFADIRRDYNV